MGEKFRGAGLRDVFLVRGMKFGLDFKPDTECAFYAFLAEVADILDTVLADIRLLTFDRVAVVPAGGRLHF